MVRWWIVSVACTVLLPAALPAQAVSLNAVTPGVRLRVTANCVAPTRPAGRSSSPNRRDGTERCERYEGTFARRTADSLILDERGRERALALSSVRAIAAQLGRQGSAAIGAAIGGAIGLAAGVVSAATTECQPDNWFRDLCETSQVASPLMGALMGGGVGWLIGSFVPRDRWVPVAPTRAAP